MKKILSILLIVGIMLSFSACQPTPEEAIVVPKDAERMVEQASSPENGSPISDLAISEDDYTFECSGLDGRLRVSVNAKIQYPNAVEMPIARVAMTGFSQEAVTGIFNYFFPNEKPYDVSGNARTKQEIEKEILAMKRKLADGTYASELGYNKQEYRDLIARVEAEYESAPETASEIVRSDGIMRLKELQNAGRYYVLDVRSDVLLTNTYKSLSVNSVDPSSKEALFSGFGSHLSYHDASTPGYATLGIQRTDGTSLPAALTMSFDTALGLCDDLFAAAELSDDFCFGAAFVVDDRGIGQFSGSGKEMGAAAENNAYKIFYTRKVDGIPIFVNMNPARIDNGYSIPWNYEYICFTVDNNGIMDFSWNNPIEVIETVQQNASLKSFHEIIGVFETMVKVQYEAETDLWTGGRGEMDVSIDAIQLCFVRIHEQNSDGATGLLVPAWVFYGNNRVTGADGNVIYDLDHGTAHSWNAEPYPVLIINAIDGSLIDLESGY